VPPLLKPRLLLRPLLGVAHGFSMPRKAGPDVASIGLSLLGVEASSMMQIFIKTTTGKQVVLEARYTDTVASVKAQIQHKEGISPEQQTLVYDRMALDDARTLAGCGIQRESTLHLELPGTIGQSQGRVARTAAESRRCKTVTVPELSGAGAPST
jgi:hypothetical protein